MHLRLAAVVLFLALPVTGRAALTPYFRLDSLVLLSDVVVCQAKTLKAPVRLVAPEVLK